MSPRTAVRTLAITAITGMGLTALAAPAHAAETITCPTGAPAQSLTLSGTGPFEFLNNSGGAYCQGFNVTTTIPAVDSPPVANGISLKKSVDEVTFTSDIAGSAWVNQTSPWENTQAGIQITATGVSGTIVVEFYQFSNTMTPVYTYTITVGSGGGGGGDDTPSGGDDSVTSAPGVHIQQFAVPTTGACDEAAPEGLNWGGASSGGWGESWAQWANDGNGGNVCTRTLGYNSSTGTWEVQ